MILDNLEDLQVAYEARVQKENLGGNDPDALYFLLKGRQPAVARVLAVLYELEYRKQDLLIKQDYMGAAEVRDDVQSIVAGLQNLLTRRSEGAKTP